LLALAAGAVLPGDGGSQSRNSAKSAIRNPQSAIASASAPEPQLVLWAWERPEDLRFAGPDTGVAFLARTVFLRGGEVSVQPRLQPLRFADGAPLIAVVRVETDRAQPPSLAGALRARAAAAVGEAARLPGIVSLQVDYDAAVSERAFYAGLLRDLRRQMPPGVGLSITALASWCSGDRWLAGLPIDEAVPMLFRMGPDRRPILLHLKAGGDFSEPACRHSLGISTDEPMPLPPLPRRRLWVFHPRPWSPAALQKLRKMLGAGN
jgi:hypothetical protein